ncbi:MAG: hypothetical protein IJP90_06970 [Treponema sp.]|nr:hypothetical protein [Treponema sp.]
MEYDIKAGSMKFKHHDRIELKYDGEYEASLEAIKWQGGKKDVRRCSECSFEISEERCALSQFCRDTYFITTRTKYN